MTNINLDIAPQKILTKTINVAVKILCHFLLSLLWLQ